MVIMLNCFCKLVDETLFSKKNFMKNEKYFFQDQALGCAFLYTSLSSSMLLWVYI